MAWEISSSGFQMTLSGYIPELIEEDFAGLVGRAVHHGRLAKEDITGWCIHPGGKRILEAIQKSLSIPCERFREAYDVLKDYGNMSSPTILFVLKSMMQKMEKDSPSAIFGAAFGPGLTMETFIVSC